MRARVANTLTNSRATKVLNGSIDGKAERDSLRAPSRACVGFRGAGTAIPFDGEAIDFRAIFEVKFHRDERVARRITHPVAEQIVEKGGPHRPIIDRCADVAAIDPGGPELRFPLGIAWTAAEFA